MHLQHRLDKPIITTQTSPQLQGNVNGPSLIVAPRWLAQPLGRYYLYFAHHEGTSIRLATADSLDGPWQLFEGGTLQLSQSGFAQVPPSRDSMLPEVLEQIDLGIDGDYAHIASPDVHVDEQQEVIKMYFHGRLPDGSQKTRLATSRDGTHFEVRPELLGNSYFRVFETAGWHFALALNGLLYRSADGCSGFEQGQRITDEPFRHCAVLVTEHKITVFWTRPGDCPESLLVSILDTSQHWTSWSLRDTVLLHSPQRDWEGADVPAIPSRFGGIMQRVCQLRDPCVFREAGKTWLLYAVAGEQGIAIAELLD